MNNFFFTGTKLCLSNLERDPDPISIMFLPIMILIDIVLIIPGALALILHKFVKGRVNE